MLKTTSPLTPHDGQPWNPPSHSPFKLTTIKQNLRLPHTTANDGATLLFPFEINCYEPETLLTPHDTLIFLLKIDCHKAKSLPTPHNSEPRSLPLHFPWKLITVKQIPVYFTRLWTMEQWRWRKPTLRTSRLLLAAKSNLRYMSKPWYLVLSCLNSPYLVTFSCLTFSCMRFRKRRMGTNLMSYSLLSDVISVCWGVFLVFLAMCFSRATLGAWLGQAPPATKHCTMKKKLPRKDEKAKEQTQCKTVDCTTLDLRLYVFFWTPDKISQDRIRYEKLR